MEQIVCFACGLVVGAVLASLVSLYEEIRRGND